MFCKSLFFKLLSLNVPFFILAYAFLLLFPFLSLNAQFHQAVFPNLTGQDLLNQLISTYKPASVLPPGMARDTMIAKIDLHNDSLTCVYTGFTIYIDPNQDPSQAAFMNGSDNGLNTEHTYPQSLGASGLARGDLHHLFPARINVNTDRGNLPFGNISDNQTNNWYFQDQVLHQIPSEQIDLYSEQNHQFFEPREDHKGNVARAMFYFYTMYKEMADNENPNYFENQRTSLCQWHWDDPVDEKEWERTFKIAPYQHDKPNPYVLDCSLAERTYCNNMDRMCETSAATKRQTIAFFLEQNKPNPFKDKTLIRYHLERAFNVRLVVYNVWGQELAVLVEERQLSGTHEIELTNRWGQGMYFCQLQLIENGQAYFYSQKMLVQK